MSQSVNLETLATEIWLNSQAHGFWDYDKITDEVLCTKLALIHSEVTEVLEAIRKGKGPEEVTKEICDILIRSLDLYCGAAGVGVASDNLSDMLKYKHDYNKSRPHKHGHKF